MKASLAMGLSAALALTPVAAAAAPVPAVTTEAGAVSGTRTDDVESFKSIPYAAPPVGPLRWRAPQPAEPWQGVRVADRFGSSCLQPV